LKRTVLFFTVDTIPGSGRNVSGGGLRAWGLGEGLKSKGHEVIYSMPRKIVEGGNFSKEFIDYAYQPEHLWKIIRKVVPDVIIFEQWGLATYLEKTNIPVIIDLHGSLIIENYFRKHRGLHYNIAAKIKTLTKADFIICPSQRQKNYFIPWLMLSGFLVGEESIAVVPVSLSPELPQKNPSDELTFIFSGGLWPWINPFPALDIVAEQVSKLGNGQLKVFAQKPDIKKLLPKDKFGNGKNFSFAGIKDMDRVKINPFVPHENLLKELSTADVAVDIYQWNRERELAFSTRTIEFLWSGLPVIHADYSEISQYITEYQAGWCLDPNDVESIRKVVSEICDDPFKAREYGKNAQRLVREHFTWERTIDPLNNYVMSPLPKSGKKTFFDLVSLEFDRIEEETVQQLEKMKIVLDEKSRELENKTDKIAGLEDELKKNQDLMTETAKENEIEKETLIKKFEAQKEALNSDFEEKCDVWVDQISTLKNRIKEYHRFETKLQNDLQRSEEEAQHLQGVLRSIQERLPFRAYKVFSYRLRRLWVQYPTLLWLFMANFFSNTYMSRWCKKMGIRIFPGQ
jgi:glycosyltransferase involved in cell wall biosynthesis